MVGQSARLVGWLVGLIGFVWLVWLACQSSWLGWLLTWFGCFRLVGWLVGGLVAGCLPSWLADLVVFGWFCGFGWLVWFGLLVGLIGLFVLIFLVG